MEYLGTMIGHGKVITRKGTKKSGLSYVATCPQGEVGVALRDVDGVTNVEINVYKDGAVSTINGSIETLFNFLKEA